MERRHELDWLRIILFALLVPHHVAVGFVDWGVDIYRFTNNQLAGDGMTLFIYWSHSWRLPSLFMIAGIGTWFLTRKAAGAGVLGARLWRLLLPVVFATFLLNVFGGYAIARMTGDPRGLLAFWASWLTEPAPRQVQHLWFLVSLAAYTLLLWPVIALRPRLARLPVPWLLMLLIVAAALPVILVKPHAAAIAGEGYQFPYYAAVFAGGVLIGARHAEVLDWTMRHRRRLLAAAILLFLLKAGLLTAELLRDEPTGEALARGGWVPLGLAPRWTALFSLVEAATAWAWCLAALGLAARHLSRPAPILPVLGRAVFPLYVLHFPVVLVLLALATRVALPWPLEFAALCALVLGVSWALWRFAERVLGRWVVLIGGRSARAA